MLKTKLKVAELLTYVCKCGNSESTIASTNRRERFQPCSSKNVMCLGRGCASCKTRLEDFTRKEYQATTYRRPILLV